MKDTSSGSKKKRYTKYTEPLAPTGSLFPGESATGSSDECIFTLSTQIQRVQSTLSNVLASQVLTLKKSGLELQAQDDSGQIVGYIVTAANNKLISCIDRGYEYSILVISISGKTCLVRIQPRQ